ncbi:MAG: CPBP family intramembrane glutamic endopeptidase [Bacillota bacterium]
MFQKIKNFVVNEEENRLRGPWRIILRRIIKILFLIIIFLFLSEKSVDLLVEDNYSWTSLKKVTKTGFVFIVTLISVFLTAKLIDKRNISLFKTSWNKKLIIDLVFAFMSTAGVITLFFLVELKTGLISIKEISFNSRKLFLGFLTCLLIGFREEILFRWYYLINLSESLNIKKHISTKAAVTLALVLASILFSAAHIESGDNAPKALLFSHFISGLVYGGLYTVTRKLSIPIAMHIAHNFFLGIIFGHFDAVSLIEIKFDLSKYLSIAANLAHMIIAVLSGGLVLLWLKMRYGQLEIDTSLSEYE